MAVTPMTVDVHIRCWVPVRIVTRWFYFVLLYTRADTPHRRISRRLHLRCGRVR